MRQNEAHWSQEMKNMVKKVSVMKQVQGLQFVSGKNDKYWMGFMEEEELENFYDAYTHQAQIGFRAKIRAGTEKEKGRKLKGKVKILDIRGWEPDHKGA